MNNTLASLLTTSSSSAFSNLFDVSFIDDNAPLKEETFPIRIKSFKIDGISILASQNSSTYQNMITKIERPKEIQLTIREKNDLSLYHYLYDWMTKHLYDPETNKVITGEEGKKKTIRLVHYGDTNDTTKLTITCDNAMLKSLPSLDLRHEGSIPIDYSLSFYIETIKIGK